MKRSSVAGFTLIEILLAFGLLALALTLLLGTLSGASRQLRQAGDAGQAALYAQTLLDERLLLLSGAMQSRGELEHGRYQWTLVARPWQPTDVQSTGAQMAQPLEDPFAARLLHVQLQMYWAERGVGQQLTVNTLRLVLPPPQEAMR